MFGDAVLEKESYKHSHTLGRWRVMVLSQVGAYDAMLCTNGPDSFHQVLWVGSLTRWAEIQSRCIQ